MAELDIPLTGELATHDGNLKSIKLREPTARDYMDLALPFRVKKHPDGAQEISVDAALVLKWVERLSGIGSLILATLNRADMWALINAVPAWIGSDPDGSGVDSKN